MTHAQRNLIINNVFEEIEKLFKEPNDDNYMINIYDFIMLKEKLLKKGYKKKLGID